MSHREKRACHSAHHPRHVQNYNYSQRNKNTGIRNSGVVEEVVSICMNSTFALTMMTEGEKLENGILQREGCETKLAL